MEKCIIVAVADNGAIGINGNLPWHISEDLKFFKRTTLGYPVIMGRTTFESLGRPLPGRQNIVLSRNRPIYEGASVAASLEEAFSLTEGAERCFVIGGAKIYEQTISMVDRLYITRVHTSISEADAFFPGIDLNTWQEISRSDMMEDKGVQFEFVEYIRK